MPNFHAIGDIVVKRFANEASGETVTRHRYGPSSTVAFRRVEGEKTSTPGIRVFLPPVGSRTDRRTEGTRRAGEFTFHTQTEFRAADEKAGHRADDVEREDGSVYTVEDVANRWNAGRYYRVTALLANKGPA